MRKDDWKPRESIEPLEDKNEKPPPTSRIDFSKPRRDIKSPKEKTADDSSEPLKARG
jgi:hypothetical protein